MKNYENGRIIVAVAVVVVIVVGTAAAAVAADTHTQYTNDKMSQRKQEEVKIYESEKRKKRNIIPYLIDVSCQLREFLYMFVMLLSDNEEQKKMYI